MTGFCGSALAVDTVSRFAADVGVAVVEVLVAGTGDVLVPVSSAAWAVFGAIVIAPIDAATTVMPPIVHLLALCLTIIIPP